MIILHSSPSLPFIIFPFSFPLSHPCIHTDIFYPLYLVSSSFLCLFAFLFVFFWLFFLLQLPRKLNPMDIALRPSDNTLLFGTWPCTTPSLANLCEVRGFFFFHHFLSQVRGAWRRRKNLHTKGPINDGHLESHHTHTSWGCAHIHCHQQSFITNS